MKKKHLFIIGLAIIFMIGGSVGSFIFYQRLATEREESKIQKKFKYDQSENLVLLFKNGANVNISSSNDDYIRMNKSGLNFESTHKNDTTWTIQKENKTTTVTIDNKINEQKIEPRFFSFGSITDDAIYLKIPDGYKSVTLNGDNIDVHGYDLTLENLDITTKKGAVSLSSINAQSLNVETKYGYVDATGIKTDNRTSLISTSGSVSYRDSNARDVNIESKSGDVFTADTKGDLSIKNQHGETSINHVLGKVDVENKNNDIYFHSNALNKEVTLTTVHGNIQAEIDKKSYDEMKKEFTTENGSLDIFNKNLSSDTEYKTNKGNNLMKITSKNGDISVDELDEDDTHYED